MAMSIKANVAAKPPRKSQLRRLLGCEAAALGLALSSPVMVLMLALVFVPFVVTLWESFHRVNPMLPGTQFVSIKNYVQMFKDGQVHSAWINTWIYVILAVVIEILGGLGSTLLLNNVKTGRRWLLAAAILTFLGAWGQFSVPLVFTPTIDTKPLTVLIPEFATKNYSIMGLSTPLGY